ncbi:MAG TPA: hypothetical protein VIX84_15270, partial [Acidimicrobiales bacterium]
MSTVPLLCEAAVAVVGVSVTGPTNAPEGIPVPVTERLSSVMTAELSAITDVPAAAVAWLSVRAPGEWLPPPSRQVPAGCGVGKVWATQVFGRS